MALVDLLGAKLQGKEGEVETSSLSGQSYYSKGEGRYVGLYFSAHWCPPCRGFTPTLGEFYEAFKKKDANKLEIVFVSSDKSQGDFDGYYADMPWLALPFVDRERKEKLSQKFGVTGIPTLIILDSETIEIVCAQARNKVMDDPTGDDFPWKK